MKDKHKCEVAVLSNHHPPRYVMCGKVAKGQLQDSQVWACAKHLEYERLHTTGVADWFDLRARQEAFRDEFATLAPDYNISVSVGVGGVSLRRVQLSYDTLLNILKKEKCDG